MATTPSPASGTRAACEVGAPSRTPPARDPDDRRPGRADLVEAGARADLRSGLQARLSGPALLPLGDDETVTIDEAAGAEPTLRTLLTASSAAAMIVIPPFIWLVHLFDRPLTP